MALLTQNQIESPVSLHNGQQLNALYGEHIPGKYADLQKPGALYYSVKRVLDLVLASAGLLLLFPGMVLIAIWIKLDDGGPIIHFREIIGHEGTHFFALKFRTMRTDADVYLDNHPDLLKKYQQNMKLLNDPRVTRSGRLLRKSSLDELPQLLNIIAGQMTLVGPRIIHPSELSRYGEGAEKLLSVKPGLTGLWQISGRQHICYAERVKLDLEYIDRRSTSLDLHILLKTIKVCLLQTGM